MTCTNGQLSLIIKLKCPFGTLPTNLLGILFYCSLFAITGHDQMATSSAGAKSRRLKRHRGEHPNTGRVQNQPSQQQSTHSFSAFSTLSKQPEEQCQSTPPKTFELSWVTFWCRPSLESPSSEQLQITRKM